MGHSAHGAQENTGFTEAHAATWFALGCTEIYSAESVSRLQDLGVAGKMGCVIALWPLTSPARTHPVAGGVVEQHMGPDGVHPGGGHLRAPVLKSTMGG